MEYKKLMTSKNLRWWNSALHLIINIRGDLMKRIVFNWKHFSWLISNLNGTVSMNSKNLTSWIKKHIRKLHVFLYKKPGEWLSFKSFLFIVWNAIFLVLNVSYLVS